MRDDRGWICRAAVLCVVACLQARAWAGEPRDVKREIREFKISVDGKERGKCTMTIHARDDGSEKMQIEAGLKFDYVVYVYRYHSTGTEIWKDDRLIELENTADLGKTRYRLLAQSTGKGLGLSIDGQKSDFPADTWATSYWRIPDRLARHELTEKPGVVPAGGTKSGGGGKAKSVLLLDSDKGQKLRGELKFVGTEMITVAGKRRACDHYRLSGDVQVDLWYDDARRLVRQDGVDSGHKSLLELTRLSSD